MAEILTAQTEQGWAAVEQVMAHSYEADLSAIPPEWIRVLVDEDVPISFVAIDPNRQIEYPKGSVRYAFLSAGSTREDLRGQGYFRQLLEDTFDELRAAGIPWIIARLPYAVGLRFGFQVFTHNSAFVLRPEEIEQTFGGGRPEDTEGMLTIDESPGIQENLLVVTRERSLSEAESVAALREAAWIARSRGKSRILFEHPPAPGPGSHYPIYPARHTPLMVTAMAGGARVRIAGSEPEEDEEDASEGATTVFKADMVKLLDLRAVFEQVLAALGTAGSSCPGGSVSFDTEAGQATITVGADGWHVAEGIGPHALRVPFPADAVAQMITGHRSASTLAYMYQKEIPREAAGILDTLFPRFWRFSRNESWIY